MYYNHILPSQKYGDPFLSNEVFTIVDLLVDLSIFEFRNNVILFKVYLVSKFVFYYLGNFMIFFPTLHKKGFCNYLSFVILGKF